MFQRTVMPGLEIRQFQLQDAEPVFAAVDQDRDYLRVWLPWVDGTRSPEDVRRFIASTLTQYQSNLGPQSGIWSDGRIIGSVGCHVIDWSNRNCSIGYWIAAGQQGKGIVTRSCVVVLNYLFEELGLHRVEIRCGTGNTSSCAVPQRLGFEREGVLRQAEWVNDRWVDLVVWSMLAPDWQRR